MASGRITTFANTFLVANHEHGGPVLKVVGPQETRKKRPHRKSRLGCIRCKRRKVKCDEGDPCRNCVKRKETCVRLNPASPSRGARDTPPLTSPPPELAWCPLSEPECRPINLLHMELLHHFEGYSIPTLPFQEVWPRMLQLAFQSRQHTYLVNAMLAFAAAHLDYLHGAAHAQYHRAKYALLDKALHDYREALSEPITPANCDALLGTANLIQYLMWCDLSFMEGQQQPPQEQQNEEKDVVVDPALYSYQQQHQPPQFGHHPQSQSNHTPSIPLVPWATNPPSPVSQKPLDLSSDRLYFLSTGVRQIFFMAWPLFQSATSAFTRAGLLQPCVALEDAVDARGLNWKRGVRAFMEVYDNRRYRGDLGRVGGGGAGCGCGYGGGGWCGGCGSGSGSGGSGSGREVQCPAVFASPEPSSHGSSAGSLTPGLTPGISPFPSFPSTPATSDTAAGFDGAGMSASGDPACYLEGLRHTSLSSTDDSPYKIMTLWQSHKEGQIYLENAGAHDEALVRTAYKRLATRVSVALAFVMDGGNRGDPASKMGGYGPHTDVRSSDLVRYVTTFPMMCFGPLLGMISSGDSRMLVLLFHIYRVTGALLPDDTYWWCKKRVEVMGEAIGRELRSRGLEVCLRRHGEFF